MDPVNGRVAIVTLGCKTNQFESAAILEQLTAAGYAVVDFDAGADLVIVNTCTVTAATDAQSRNLIRRARRLNPAARVVVTGCYAQIDPQSLRRIPGVSLVVGNEEKKQLLALLRTAAADGGAAVVRVADIRSVATSDPLEIQTFSQRSRAFVQIQNGCDAFCSYCIIPYARGTSRSVPVDQVVAQLLQLQDAGYREIVLTGIHIGGYGRDLHPATDLLGLLRTIASSPFDGRLRLGSIEPTELPAALCDYILAADWICPHLHIPLQAGDDEILRRMNRHYDTAMFADLLAQLQQRNPAAAIGLDVICGFPGESDAHFAATLALLQRLPFSHLHVFPFSRRPGTPAATLPDQVAADIIKDRAAQLRQLGKEKERQFRDRFIGAELMMLVEGGVKQGMRKGLSENYLPLWLPADAARPGSLCRVQISGRYGDGLRARRIASADTGV